MKGVLCEVSLMNFIPQIEGESGVTRSIVDELHSWDIQRDEVEGESCGTPSIMDEVYF